ncbi:MAG: cation:proton antiporter [Abditibacteriota bacterium]|nr:cation:proton antiporter [Abditibacteriota bacterium]
MPHELSLLMPMVFLILALIGMSFVTQKFKQPMLVGYILVGLIINLLGIDDRIDTEQFKELSDFGLTLLLFIVGLKLDVGVLKSMGNAMKIGTLQVLITALAGYGMALLMGFKPIGSIYIGMGLAFSSTIVIIKVLSDKKEIDSLPGRIDLGILIIQDIIAVVFMIVMNSIFVKSDDSFGMRMLKLAGNGAVLAGMIFILSKWILPRTLKIIAKSKEFLMIISMGLAILFAGFCEVAGFGMEVGAFLAGITLAGFKEYRYTISSLLTGIRDFMLVFFFIIIGLDFDDKNILDTLTGAFSVVIFVTVIKPYIVMLIMNVMGYKKRTGFLSGINLAQISEFSLILTTFGIGLGHLHQDATSLMVLTLITTCLSSSYLMNYSSRLYEALNKSIDALTGRHEGAKKRATEDMDTDEETVSGYHAVIIGAGGFGSTLSDILSEYGKKLLEVDFDPMVVSERRNLGKNIIYGDAESPGFVSQLKLTNVKWVISTIHDVTAVRHMQIALANAGFKGVFATACDLDDMEEMKSLKNVDLVFDPNYDAAKEAVNLMYETEMKQKAEKIQKAVDGTSDHYIICGYGRMGRQIARDLGAEGVPFVIIESNPDHFEEIEDQRLLYVKGNASSDKALELAGISRAKGLIAVYPSDEENVFIVLTARNLNPSLDIVARSIEAENADKLKRAGANKVISPYLFGGRKMAAAILRPTVFDFNELTYHGNSFDILFEEFTIAENSALVGKTIRESNFRGEFHVTIVAVRHPDGEMVANPDMDTKFQAGDKLVVICNGDQLHKMKSSPDFVESLPSEEQA